MFDDLMRDAGFQKTVESASIEEGVYRRLAAWYREYHKRY